MPFANYAMLDFITKSIELIRKKSAEQAKNKSPAIKASGAIITMKPF